MRASLPASPAAEHRETIASAGRAAAAGGVTSFIMMPDTDPVIDDIALVEFVRKTRRDRLAGQRLSGAALTKGLAGEEMTEIGLLQGSRRRRLHRWPPASMHNAQVLRRAMTYAREFGAVISLRDPRRISRRRRRDERGPASPPGSVSPASRAKPKSSRSNATCASPS